jgi:AraC-like DNA-binding protein
MLEFFYPMIGGERILPFYADGIGIHNQQHEHRPHGFHIYQILFCTAGEGVLNVYGKTYSITPGISFYLPPNVPHEYYPLSDNWKTQWLTFQGYQANDFMQKFGLTQAAVYPLSDLNKLDTIFRRIFRVLDEDRIYGNYYAAGYLYDFFLEYYRQISSKFTLTQEDHNPVILKLIHYIDNNYKSNITMEQLCKIANVTPQHLCRLFKKHLKARPMEYIAKRRLHEAKGLLRATSKTMREIAEETGFHKSDYFTTLFKRYENMLPSEYRKMMR